MSFSTEQPTHEHHDSDSETDSHLEDEESQGDWSIGSFSQHQDKKVEEATNPLEKPRQRILTANRNFLIAVVAMYTASHYFDALIAHDVIGYGPSEPIWHETSFPVEWDTLPAKKMKKGKVEYAKPIPLLPEWYDDLYTKTLMASNVNPEYVDISLKVLQAAIVVEVSGVADVRQKGIMRIDIRFFKPYLWGVQSANLSLATILEEAGNPGSKMYTKTNNPLSGSNDWEDQPSKIDTYNMNLGSPLRGRIDPNTQRPEIWLKRGRSDGRPPTWEWFWIFAYLQIFSMIFMGLTAVVLSKFAWEAQVEEHGDVRLSVTQDDPNADMYRMKWPLWVTACSALFRLECMPELSESLKAKKEYYTLIALMTVGCVTNILPSFLLQLQLSQGSGAGPSFGIVLSLMLKMGAYLGTTVLWERSNGFTATNVAVKLSWEAHTSLTWQRLALWRFTGIMSRLLPIAVVMTVYSEIAAVYIAGLDAVIIFFMMAYTGLRQRCTMGNEKCTCFNFLYFYITRLPSLLFFYNDSYTGRSYDNSIIHPLLYLCARAISLGVTTYFWWVAQVIVWGDQGAIPSPNINGTVNWTRHEARDWLDVKYNETFPTGLITDDPLSGFPTMVAAGIFFIAYVVLFVGTWKRAGSYYNLPRARRRNMCFCWNWILDNCFRKLCNLCGGKAAIPPPPPKSKFGGNKMDAVAIEAARPKASLMLKRLRANMANQESGGRDSYNKYRMRNDDELSSVYTQETGASGASGASDASGASGSSGGGSGGDGAEGGDDNDVEE